ncbi:hypothetical protein [Streptomyces sp. N2A]|uniref:hypothetical protein n=1 Tax=Streptomyces sp. N2A TaxID=3073936 RepID=UPI002870886C|nr:hypothetical protein [Streptomyces sp. N2A]
MARDFEDDAPRRIQDANELVLARQRDADQRIYVVTTNLVIDAQEKLARRRRIDRIWRVGWRSAGCPYSPRSSARASPGSPRAPRHGSSWVT